MRRIKITVAYDGTNYCGWQIQPNGITIEEVINKAIFKLTKEKIAIIGASRTDAGVHAMGNVAVFDTESTIPAERFSYALNQRLPKDIVIIKSEEVPLDWHPRYRDCSKTYEYHILNAEIADPLNRLTATLVSYKLNVDDMRKAASYLVGEHDFESFSSIHRNTETTVRTIYELEIIEKPARFGRELVVRITGNGFLYNMVRIIVGTLLRVGRGFYEPEKVKEILEMKDRQAAGNTAQPQGLCLIKIDYGEENAAKGLDKTKETAVV